LILMITAVGSVALSAPGKPAAGKAAKPVVVATILVYSDGTRVISAGKPARERVEPLPARYVTVSTRNRRSRALSEALFPRSSSLKDHSHAREEYAVLPGL
jgi:hypothetical protein